MQTQFRIKLGLIVDRPKPGYGSSDDGNTARRFFQNAAISAEVTGVDEKLIHQFHVILQVISSGFDIDDEKFKDYCVNTAHSFVALYPWYYMPTSVHKLLIHGAEIVKYLDNFLKMPKSHAIRTLKTSDYIIQENAQENRI